MECVLVVNHQGSEIAVRAIDHAHGAILENSRSIWHVAMLKFAWYDAWNQWEIKQWHSWVIHDSFASHWGLPFFRIHGFMDQQKTVRMMFFHVAYAFPMQMDSISFHWFGPTGVTFCRCFFILALSICSLPSNWEVPTIFGWPQGAVLAIWTKGHGALAFILRKGLEFASQKCRFWGLHHTTYHLSLKIVWNSKVHSLSGSVWLHQQHQQWTVYVFL